MAIVRKDIDLDNLPPMSAEALARLDAIKDEDIDYSDIPEITEESINNGVLLKDWQPQEPTNKQKISVRLDSDILTWLRSYGRGYQTRMNEILRLAMQQHTD